MKSIIAIICSVCLVATAKPITGEQAAAVDNIITDYQEENAIENCVREFQLLLSSKIWSTGNIRSKLCEKGVTYETFLEMANFFIDGDNDSGNTEGASNSTSEEKDKESKEEEETDANSSSKPDGAKQYDTDTCIAEWKELLDLNDWTIEEIKSLPCKNGATVETVNDEPES